MIHYYPQRRKNPVNDQFFYYPQIAPVRPMSLEEICGAITEVCTLTRHDVKAVISALQEQIIKAMQNGHSVRLGDLGSFRPTLSSSGSPTAAEVKASNIVRVNCRFTPGAMIYNRIALTNPEVRFGSFHVFVQKPQDSGSEHI